MKNTIALEHAGQRLKNGDAYAVGTRLTIAVDSIVAYAISHEWGDGSHLIIWTNNQEFNAPLKENAMNDAAWRFLSEYFEEVEK